MLKERKVSKSMYQQKQLDVHWQLKQLDEDGRFAGYASVFDVVDSQRDVMEKGAFASAVAKGAEQVKLLWQHNMAEPVGVIRRLFEDARGLYVEGQLLMDVARAREAYSLLKEGVVKGLSIGYSPTRYSYDPDSGVRYLKAVELWEVSLVTFPANEAAQISVVKGRDAQLACSRTEEADWQSELQRGAVMELATALDKAVMQLRAG